MGALAWAAGLGVGGVSAPACNIDRHPATRPIRMSLEHAVSGQQRTGAADAQIAQYLRAVAVVLAAPNASADRVLDAAGATDAKRQPFFVHFRPGLDHLGRGSLQLDRNDPAGRPPAAIDFYPDTAAAAVVFADVARVLGPWRQLPPGPGPAFAYKVQFEAPGAVHRQIGHPDVEVEFDALLTANPTDPGARITRIGMRRDVFE